ncbi:uncharacterized protein BDR25DRAFT_313459 [Lindgomyces ingoldianus]|uniref:Uncharacterized protein n=1 Tax=Lindgomyces ingoldianus TaxID=673940 RepID=A0ACB6QX51_9PLEO|nr:uncharacterized protein BDR25DRAFT_313459 [Lindgomyces ingoldianus]KAF2471496.1 hypothetical protein BDR25DRAFT_313459 [Lindgomyces ingoldianus]
MLMERPKRARIPSVTAAEAAAAAAATAAIAAQRDFVLSSPLPTLKTQPEAVTIDLSAKSNSPTAGCVTPMAAAPICSANLSLLLNALEYNLKVKYKLIVNRRSAVYRAPEQHNRFIWWLEDAENVVNELLAMPEAQLKGCVLSSCLTRRERYSNCRIWPRRRTGRRDSTATGVVVTRTLKKRKRQQARQKAEDDARWREEQREMVQLQRENMRLQPNFPGFGQPSLPIGYPYGPAAAASYPQPAYPLHLQQLYSPLPPSLPPPIA